MVGEAAIPSSMGEEFPLPNQFQPTSQSELGLNWFALNWFQGEHANQSQTASKLVQLTLWASWCGHIHMCTPHIITCKHTLHKFTCTCYTCTYTPHIHMQHCLAINLPHWSGPALPKMSLLFMKFKTVTFWVWTKISMSANIIHPLNKIVLSLGQEWVPTRKRRHETGMCDGPDGQHCRLTREDRELLWTPLRFDPWKH